MFKTIFSKSLFTLRWQFFGWLLAIFGIVFFTMILYPSFSQDGIEGLVNSVPPELKSLIGEISDFKTIPGYIGQQIFGPNLYIISIIMSIMIFLGISASEEADGRLQTLLSYPVSRTQIYFHKLLAASLVVALISCSVFIGIQISLLLINETADVGRIWESIVGFTLINLVYGIIVFATAMLTGNKGKTILVASGYTVLSVFITSLAPAVEGLKHVEQFSLLHYYNNPQIMTNGLNGEHILILGGVGIVLIIIGWLGFIRRDVRTN